MAAALAADSTEVASGGITQAGAELASTAVGAVMAGAGTAGVAGVTQAGESESASALVGAGAGVPTGRVTRMPMAIRTITPTFHITHTMGRPGMRQRTRIGITVAEIRVTTCSGRIRTIASRKDRLAQTTRHR